jgi:hypothetical protein
MYFIAFKDVIFMDISTPSWYPWSICQWTINSPNDLKFYCRRREIGNMLLWWWIGCFYIFLPQLVCAELSVFSCMLHHCMIQGNLSKRTKKQTAPIENFQFYKSVVQISQYLSASPSRWEALKFYQPWSTCTVYTISENLQKSTKYMGFQCLTFDERFIGKGHWIFFCKNLIISIYGTKNSCNVIHTCKIH